MNSNPNGLSRRDLYAFRLGHTIDYDSKAPPGHRILSLARRLHGSPFRSAQHSGLILEVVGELSLQLSELNALTLPDSEHRDRARNLQADAHGKFSGGNVSIGSIDPREPTGRLYNRLRDRFDDLMGVLSDPDSDPGLYESLVNQTISDFERRLNSEVENLVTALPTEVDTAISYRDI